jgi:hypothetical protein
MEERLTIRNFGPIADLDVTIKAFTFFIGPQGSGKSTAAKVLTICRDLSWYIQILTQDERIHEPFKKFCIEEYFQDDTYMYYQNGMGTIEVVYQDGAFQLIPKGASPKQAEKALSQMVLAENEALLKKKGMDDVNGGVDEKYTPLLQANSRMMLYVPAERNLAGAMSKALASMIVARIPLYDALIEYMSVFEKAKNELKEYFVPFLNISFSINDGQEKIWIGEGSNRHNPLPLQSCSSGLQSVLPLLMSIDYSLKAVCFDAFVIEEPEQNLFPSNQKELVYHLVEKYRNSKMRGMVFTTHSPYILSCMNVVLLAGLLYEKEGLRDEVIRIVGENHHLNPSDVAVYRLNPSAEKFCVDLKNPTTGLIGINELDSASESIGEDYDQLYKLYIQELRKK